jgi:hypothetical protein
MHFATGEPNVGSSMHTKFGEFVKDCANVEMSEQETQDRIETEREDTEPIYLRRINHLKDFNAWCDEDHELNRLLSGWYGKAILIVLSHLGRDDALLTAFRNASLEVYPGEALNVTTYTRFDVFAEQETAPDRTAPAGFLEEMRYRLVRIEKELRKAYKNYDDLAEKFRQVQCLQQERAAIVLSTKMNKHVDRAFRQTQPKLADKIKNDLYVKLFSKLDHQPILP